VGLEGLLDGVHAAPAVAAGSAAAHAGGTLLDRGHLEVLVDLDLDLGAVALADVALVDAAVVGLGADDAAGDLGEGRGLDLLLGLAGQRRSRRRRSRRRRCRR